MRIIRSIAEMRDATRALEDPVGFVPTMGSLHRGHLALVNAARDRCSGVVASIFVNPLQFGPSEDYARYPRAFDADIERLDGAGVDLVFAPAAETFVPSSLVTAVDPGPIALRYEGALRPGHFHGVATIVAKLLHVVMPHVAFFGEKDAQQVRVIAAMVRDLDFPTRIEIVPTVRDDDGVALSSRNAYLSRDERHAAAGLYRALAHIVAAVREGVCDRETVITSAREHIRPPLREAYLDLVDPDRFEPVETARPPALAIGSVWLGTTRLIDNLAVT